MTADPGQLIIRLQDKVIQTVSLGASVLTIGRTPDNTLPLPDRLVSRQHAELRLGPQGLVLTDVGSSNGTFVGAERLLPNQPRPIPPGGSFQIGPFDLTYLALPVAADDDDLVLEAAPEGQPAEPPPSEAAALPEGEQERVVVADDTLMLAETAALARVLEAPAAQRALLPHEAHLSRYLLNLPIIFHDNQFLGRYLHIFEAIWEPLEHRQDFIAMYFDPRTCPVGFLPWLAAWVGLALNEHWPEARRRRLVAEGMDLYRWRGTRYGLARMIEVCTGLTPEIIDLSSASDADPGQPFMFRVRLTLTPESGVDRTFVESLVQAHKPAHAGYILELGP